MDKWYGGKENRFQRKFSWIFLTGQCSLLKNLSNNECAVLIWSPFLLGGAWNTIVHFHVSQCSLVFSSWLIALSVEFLSLEGELVWWLESILIWSLFLLLLSIPSMGISSDMVPKPETTITQYTITGLIGGSFENSGKWSSGYITGDFVL